MKAKKQHRNPERRTIGTIKKIVHESK